MNSNGGIGQQSYSAIFNRILTLGHGNVCLKRTFLHRVVW